jgi:aminopeptidase N
MEEASGQDLGWFFDQWVYGAGAPRLDVRQVWHARTKTLNVIVSQLQGDTITPSVFRLPMEIKITTAAGDTTEKVDLTKRIQTLAFKRDTKPSKLELDPMEKIPIKSVKVHPLTALR